MLEAADPSSREIADRANNAELVRTLKSSVGTLQAKNKDLLREMAPAAKQSARRRRVPTAGIKHGRALSRTAESSITNKKSRVSALIPRR